MFFVNKRRKIYGLDKQLYSINILNVYRWIFLFLLEYAKWYLFYLHDDEGPQIYVTNKMQTASEW